MRTIIFGIAIISIALFGCKTQYFKDGAHRVTFVFPPPPQVAFVFPPPPIA